jgi:hypothetical protein
LPSALMSGYRFQPFGPSPIEAPGDGVSMGRSGRAQADVTRTRAEPAGNSSPSSRHVRVKVGLRPRSLGADQMQGREWIRRPGVRWQRLLVTRRPWVRPAEGGPRCRPTHVLDAGRLDPVRDHGDRGEHQGRSS